MTYIGWFFTGMSCLCLLIYLLGKMKGKPKGVPEEHVDLWI